jgi:hypothetical protein
MQALKPLTKLLVIPAFCPLFAAAEGLWNVLDAEAGFGTRFWPGEALKAPDPVGND